MSSGEINNDGLDDIWPRELAELELWPREHDLPPRWDGLPVQWGEWSATEDIFICPPLPKERCEHCRSTRAPLMNLGRIWTDPTATPNVLTSGPAYLERDRHLVATLSIFRCVDCKRDYVLDGDGQAWNLDQTDYTDAGSQALR